MFANFVGNGTHGIDDDGRLFELNRVTGVGNYKAAPAAEGRKSLLRFAPPAILLQASFVAMSRQAAVLSGKYPREGEEIERHSEYRLASLLQHPHY